MRLINRAFSTVKDQVHQLKDIDYFNIPENILNLTDKKLLTI